MGPETMLLRTVNTVRKLLGELNRATALGSFDLKEEFTLWDFRKEAALKEWSCISDKDGGGSSHACLDYNGKGTGILFHGNLSTELPADQSAKYSGYCAVRSKPGKSLRRGDSMLDLTEFDAFQLRVRGDGRRFIVNLQSPGLARKDDVWQCFLYTRGGPEWENIVLPFADFFLTHRGYLQDHQMSFARNRVSTLGLLLADRINGTFALELQYIKAVRTFNPTKESHLD